MSDDNKSVQDQVNDTIIDVRNEAIVQGANLYLLGRKLLLASIGSAALALDCAGKLLDRAAERGEEMTADLQQRRKQQ